MTLRTFLTNLAAERTSGTEHATAPTTQTGSGDGAAVALVSLGRVELLVVDIAAVLPVVVHVGVR